MDFDIVLELLISAKMLLAAFLGAVVGYDRELHGKEAGIRTYAGVCIGATLFTSVADHIMNDPSASSRIIANVITGIGFLGAGIIFKDDKGTSKGLTTAATIWCTAAVGVAVGLNMLVIAVAATCLLYILISMHHFNWYVKWKKSVSKKREHKSDSADIEG